MDHSPSHLSPARAMVMILLSAGLAVVGWIVLRGEAGARGLSGQILDGRERGIAGARIEIEELDRETVSMDDGSFMLEDLPPGDYWLIVEAPSGEGLSLSVRVQRLRATDLGEITLPVAPQGD